MSGLFLLLCLAAFLILVVQLEISWLVIFFIAGFGIAAMTGGWSTHLVLGLVLMLLTLLASHFVYHTFADYSPVFHQLGKVQTVKLGVHSLLRCLPIASVVFVVIALLIWRNHAIQQAIYNLDTSSDYACTDQRKGSWLVCQNHHSFEQNIYTFAERFGNTYADARQEDVYQAIDHIEKTSGDVQQQLPRLIYTGGDAAFNDGKPLYKPELPDSLHPPDCPKYIGWLTEPANCMKRALLKPLNGGYENARSESRQLLVQELSDMDEGLRNNTDATRIVALDAINRSNNDYQTSSRKTLEWIFLQNLISTLLFYLFCSYLLIKIFGYLFTRLAFDRRQGGTRLALTPLQHSSDAMNLREYGNELSLKLNNETWFTTKNRKVRYAKKGRPVFPFPFRLLFRRLSTRTWAMYRFSPEEDNQHLELYANDVTHFILIELSEADHLCFSLANLVAFSESVSLYSRFSLKMAIFFNHALFFTLAKGPGKVLLRIDGGKGKVIMGPQCPSADEGFFDPSDLVAFDLNGEYVLDAQHDLLSVYTEGHSICPIQNTFAIRQVHDEKGVRSILASVKKLFVFLLPI